MQTKSYVLIIDDEPDIRELLEITLSRMGIDSNSAESIKQGKLMLQDHTFDLCLTDMKLPDGNGIDLVRYIQKNHSDTPVAMITAHGSMELAIEALKAGAFDFVSKPVDLNDLRSLVSSALKLSEKKENQENESTNNFLGESQAIIETRKTIVKLARSQAPVFIQGESGTGKELVARMIHEQGSRSDKAFVPVNCGAIPTELMESEFFGHIKGSFTGATSDKLGLFQTAHQGTLFLDEVADLPISMQVKLLRAIQEKAVKSVGAENEITIDVRILSATHKDLLSMVESGSFRQDLFYRINVIEIDVPSLREHNEDIPLLVGHFLNKIAQSWSTEIPKITSDAINLLQHYNFPGNVRELENILERAMTMCEDNQITSNDLRLSNNKTSVPSTEKNETTDSHDDELSLSPLLSNKEREVIIKALEKTKYNKTAAAKILGISFRQLRYRLKKLDID
ncbi:Type IV fimbriae expression regulatory protein PilR [hydrothermal vent metagenome]|uniref:Type IV fimbriae expression regulatory protein PilR n=1 Tax=hydrothermal vent metagenome TaxID=652676 RepID=A0A3B1AGL6_9ZZZZ